MRFVGSLVCRVFRLCSIFVLYSRHGVDRRKISHKRTYTKMQYFMGSPVTTTTTTTTITDRRRCRRLVGGSYFASQPLARKKIATSAKQTHDRRPLQCAATQHIGHSIFNRTFVFIALLCRMCDFVCACALVRRHINSIREDILNYQPHVCIRALIRLAALARVSWCKINLSSASLCESLCEGVCNTAEVEYGFCTV